MKRKSVSTLYNPLSKKSYQLIKSTGYNICGLLPGTTQSNHKPKLIEIIYTINHSNENSTV